MGANVHSTSESMKDQIQAVVDQLPRMMQVTGEQTLPYEQALVDAQRAITPQRNQIELENYQRYAPDFARAGAEVNGITQRGQAENDLRNLRENGVQLTEAALAAQRSADPEFFRTQEALGRQTRGALDSMQMPGQGLTGSERAEASRELARANAITGNTNPNAMTTVANAMTFGRAGFERDRRLEQSNASTLGAAAGTMPMMRSGVDAAGLTTGRSSFNPGDARQTGIPTVGQGTLSTANGMMQQAGETDRAQQRLAAENSGLAQATKMMSAVGSMTSGCCWTFAEAYGAWDNIPWYVREIRNSIDHPTLRRGYKRFSLLVVPLMQKYKFVRDRVWRHLIYPLTMHAGYLSGAEFTGGEYQSHRRFWLATWNLMGKF